MRHLLALLHDGTYGTPVEPSLVRRGDYEESEPSPILRCTGTLGTRGTLESSTAAATDNIAQRVADLADAWHERMSIVLESGDVGEAEGCRIAEAEIGRLFVEAFMPGEVAT